MKLAIKVFTQSEVYIKRGHTAKEMLACPSCSKLTGVFIREANSMQCVGTNRAGQDFKRIVFERWQCLSCGNVWVEKYGVAPIDNVQKSRTIQVDRSGGSSGANKCQTNTITQKQPLLQK